MDAVRRLWLSLTTFVTSQAAKTATLNSAPRLQEGHADCTVSQNDLPSREDMDLCRETTAFSSTVSLPPPHEVRKKAEEDGIDISNTFRPDPVYFPESGIVVKWGSDVTVAEGQCLWFLRKHLNDQVPVPQIYGWTRDGDQTFLYMELVSGDRLSDRWEHSPLREKIQLCAQLRDMIAAWRCIKKDDGSKELSQIGGQALRDIIFSDGGFYPAGPFLTVRDFHCCFAKLTSRCASGSNDPRKTTVELQGLSDDVPTVFTHGDLDQSNILISRPDDGPLRIVAIIDWHQAGWYPEHWEWLKAQSVAVSGSDWVTEYLPKILEPAPYEYFYAWEYVRMATI